MENNVKELIKDLETPLIKPELERLLSELNEAIGINNMLTNDIITYSSNLQTIGVDSPVVEDKIQPISIIDRIWSEVDDLRRVNAKLTIVSKHLQSVIGD